MSMKRSMALATFAVVTLTGCSGLISGKSNRIQPTPLNQEVPSHLAQTAWSSSVSAKVEATSGNRFTLGVQTGRYFVAGDNGMVSAVSEGGGVLWNAKTDPLYTGVGVEGDKVFIGTKQGELVALSAVDGKELWRKGLYGASIVTPKAHNGVVVTVTQGGAVEAFDSATGEVKWAYMMAPTRFSMRGSAEPIVFQNDLIVSNDAGQVIRFDVQTGAVKWGVKTSRVSDSGLVGSMLDIDSAPLVVGNDLYVASIRQGISKITAQGRLLWTKGNGVYAGIAHHGGNILSVEDEGRIVALSTQNGDEQWVNTDLLGRGVSRPVIAGGKLVVADFEGYVHALDPQTGRLLSSTKVGNGAFLPDLTVIGNAVFLQEKAGRLIKVVL